MPPPRGIQRNASVRLARGVMAAKMNVLSCMFVWYE